MSAGRPTRWRKKPVVVEAIQYRPDVPNCRVVGEFVGDPYGCDDLMPHDEPWLIQTLEGVMEASPGDWIIRGVQGEFYPCKPDIFEAIYEPEDGRS